MIYLLGRSADPRTIRANAVVFLTGESLILGVTYIAHGMISPRRLTLSLLLLPAYAASLWIGARAFAGVEEVTYRRVVLSLLSAVSLLITGRSLLAVLG